MMQYSLTINSRVPFIFNGSNILQTHATAVLKAKDLSELSRLVANIAATADVPSQPDSTMIRTLASMPMYMSENRREWNVRNEGAGFTICLMPYEEPYAGEGRRYELKVVTKSGYLTAVNSSLRFTELVVDIAAHSPKDLSARIAETMSEIVPFYGLDSGLDKDVIQDIQDIRAEQLKALRDFATINSPEACWIRHPMIEAYSDGYMEISLIYKGVL